MRAARNIPGVTAAAPLSATGHTDRPYGVAVRLPGGGQVWFQILGASAPGDRYEQPAPAPVTGPRPDPMPMPELPAGKVPLALLEAALAAAVLAADEAGEIAAVALHSREAAGARYGLSVDFHDGSRAFALALATLRPGETAPAGHRLFHPDLEV